MGENRSRIANGEQCINLYPEPVPGGKGDCVLHGTPGLSSFSSGITSGPIRALFRSDENGGRVLTVGHNVLYDLSSTGVDTFLGIISASDSSPVSISYNGFEYLIISNGVGYILSGTTLTAIKDPDFPNAVMGVFLDGYFIVLARDSQNIHISGLYNGSSWNALEFGAAESAPDNALAIVEDRGYLWIFGSEKNEVFANSGNVDFPFERIQGAIMEEGIAAGASAVKLNDSLFWLSGSERGQGMVVRSRGFQSERVSTHAVEFAIQSYSTIEDATAFSYQEEGHQFYVITFPTADKTWAFDVTSNMWHQRSYWNNVTSQHQAIRASCHVFAYEKHLVGDRSSGDVYVQDLDVYADNGDTIRRVRRCPHIANEHQRIFHHSLVVDMEVGVGITSGQGSDPQLMMRHSNDGGATWSLERQGSIGKMGEYLTRVKFNRLGMARDRIYEVAVSDPVKIAFVDAYVETSMGVG